jgi:hypothetical protein
LGIGRGLSFLFHIYAFVKCGEFNRYPIRLGNTELKETFMKNSIKFFGIIAFLTAIVYTGCGGGGRAAPASDFQYELTKDGSGVRITKYIGNGGNLVIPAEIEGYPVAELGVQAFFGEDNNSYGPGYNITSVVIPASVKFIDRGCFNWIENLKSVTFLGTGVVINAMAFSKNENLSELKMPSGDNVLIPHVVGSTTMDAAFSGCKALPLAARSRLNAMGFTHL